jgi:SPP1 family predicted phage head-tail adaptor
MIPAGSLRNRITLQKPETTVSGYGERTVSWIDAFTCWADFHPLSVREFIASAQPQSQITARVVIRYRDDVDASMRIAYRGKVYNIAGVLADPDSGREYLTLPVSEVTP